MRNRGALFIVALVSLLALAGISMYLLLDADTGMRQTSERPMIPLVQR